MEENKDLNRKSLLAMFLIVLVMIASYFTQPKKVVKDGDLETPNAVDETVEIVESVPETAAVKAVTPQAIEESVLLAVAPQNEICQNKHMNLVLTNRGGLVKDIELLEPKYKDIEGNNQKLIDGTDSDPRVLIIKLGEDRDDELNRVNYKVERNEYDEYTRVSFTYKTSGKYIDETGVERESKLPPGLEIKKTYDLYKDKYDLLLNYTLANKSGQSIKIGNHTLAIGETIKTLSEEGSSAEENVVILNDNSADREDWKDLAEDGPIFKEGDNSIYSNWIAFENKYYLLALIPEDKTEVTLRAGSMKDDRPEIGIEQRLTEIKPGDEKTVTYRVFMGPKEYNLLKNYGRQLTSGLDLGFFSYFAFIILYSLNWLFAYVGNYGWAIVILTIAIKAATIPLTNKSHMAMMKNQEMQPIIDKIKDRYKDDKQRMNQEVMKAYQQSGANPLGGCLPMVIQIPIFFALFKALLFAIELKGMPFVGWITDLSRPDTIANIMGLPLNILPILMIVSMVLQQMTSPTQDAGGQGGDMQKKMAYAMPVVFGVMFYTMPSGLTLYYTLNNFLTIAQQHWLNVKHKK